MRGRAGEARVIRVLSIHVLAFALRYNYVPRNPRVKMTFYWSRGAAPGSGRPQTVQAIDGCGSCCIWCGPGHELSPEHTILNKDIYFEEQKYEVLNKSMLNSLNLGKVHMIVLHFKLGSGQS